MNELEHAAQQLTNTIEKLIALSEKCVRGEDANQWANDAQTRKTDYPQWGASSLLHNIVGGFAPPMW